MTDSMSALTSLASWAKDYWFIIAPASGGVVWLMRRVVRRITRTYRALRQVWFDLSEKVSRIDAALGPNGGKSVVDRLQRIEDRQKATAGIAERIQARLNADQRTAAEPRIELDAAGRVTVVNRAFERLTDRGAGDIVGLGIIGIVNPADRERVVSEWQHAVADRRWFACALRLAARGGTYRKATMYAEPMRAEDGTVIGWLALFSDFDQDTQ